MNLRPLGDYVIVKTLPAEETSASGIILPDSSDKDRPEQGEVVAVGPGKLLENGNRAPMDVTVGQRVVFKKYAPDPIQVGDEEQFVLRNDDIVAIVE